MEEGEAGKEGGKGGRRLERVHVYHWLTLDFNIRLCSAELIKLSASGTAPC